MSDKTPKSKGALRRLFLPVALGGTVAAGLTASNYLAELERMTYERPYSDFLAGVEKGLLHRVALKDGYAYFGYEFGAEMRTYIPLVDQPNILRRLQARNVEVAVVRPRKASSFEKMAGAFFDIAVNLVILTLVLRLMRGGNGTLGALQKFAGNKARLFTPKKRQTFADVAGCDEAVADLREISDYLANPEKYHRLGARIPRGALLVGPPGTGKTLLARATAGEANVPCYTISGSDFVEMFVGVGASRVRNMFEEARKNQPCILFIDEIDAVGSARHNVAGSGGEREQTLNQLLVEMDGFIDRENVIILAATNRVDTLDPALLRPGRFDRQIHVDVPDMRGREKILSIHLRDIPNDVNIPRLAAQTPGLTGADLANLVNEMALAAARRNAVLLLDEHANFARDRAFMGPLRKSRVLGDDDLIRIATRETAKAVLTSLLPTLDPVEKTTILSHGRNDGFTLAVPDRDRVSATRERLLDQLTVLAGTRVAEYMVAGPQKMSSAPEREIAQATSLARRMVMDWGLSSLGPVSYGDAEHAGGSRFETLTRKSRNYSKATDAAIDREVQNLVTEAEARARHLLHENRAAFDYLCLLLRARETVTGSDIRATLAHPPTP